MAHSVGDAVLVLSLKRRGEVVEARGRSYRVRVGGLTVSCRESDLEPVEADVKRSGRRATRVAAIGPSAPGPGGREARSSIDLHGMTTLEAREALLRHVDAALRAGHAVVEVVHGIGTGKVRATVTLMAREIASVRKVQPHPTNRGVTLLYL